MKVIHTKIPEVLILEPKVFGDARGFFFENFNENTFADATGLRPKFVQDNHSGSGRNVLRGLHSQIRQTQGKLVRVTAGEVYDVAVDLRRCSPTFGHWIGAVLSSGNRLMMWIPEGFAHGFLVLSEFAEFHYKTTDYYAPEFERCIRWDDHDLAIDWPLAGASPILSKKDEAGVVLAKADVFA